MFRARPVLSLNSCAHAVHEYAISTSVKHIMYATWSLYVFRYIRRRSSLYGDTYSVSYSMLSLVFRCDVDHIHSKLSNNIALLLFNIENLIPK